MKTLQPNEHELGAVMSMEEGSTCQSPSAPPTLSWWYSCCLVMVGAATLWYWFMFVNLASLINPHYFPGWNNMMNLVTMAFEFNCLVATFLCCWVDEVAPRFSLAVLGSVVVLAILTPLSLLVSGDTARAACWLVLTGAYGAWAGCAQVHYFGLAAALPQGKKTGLVSAGQGCGGVVGYVLYLVFGEALRLSALTNVILLMVLLIGITCSFGYGCYRLSCSSVVIEHVRDHRARLAALQETSGRLSLLQMLHLGWLPLLNVWITFFVSYLIYPNISPFRWPGSDDQLQRVNGAAPVAIMLGRIAPNFSIFFYSVRTTTVINFARFVFPVICILMARRHDVALFAAWPWQTAVLFLLSLSEGWMSTLGLIHCASAGRNLYETTKLSSLSVFILDIGLCLAIGLAPAVQAAFNI